MISANIVWLQDDPGRALDDFVSVLPPTEQKELSGFQHAERQRSFVLSRTLLRQELAPRLRVDKKDLHFSRAENGRLALAGSRSWRFSLSHSNGLIAVIVAEADCGVDIEVPRALAFERIARRYFSETEKAWLVQCDAGSREREFFRLWTLKEAAVKALQEGLANNLARLAFDVSEERPYLLDQSLGLQVWQQLQTNFFLAAAVKSADEISWQTQEIRLIDL